MGAGAMFDAVIMLDWSAAAKPTTGRDSVWWALHRPGATGPERLENPATRAEAMDDLAYLLAAEASAGRRVLLGCDFPFGHPVGAGAAAARALAAPAASDAPGWRALWRALDQAVVDGPANANNRFALAAEINRRAYDGEGPFWGRPAQRDVPGLPVRKPAGYGARYPQERRACERLIPRTQPVWKLFTTGSVGGQALLGIAALERLRRRPTLAERVAIWPFEARRPTAARPVLIAEVYPSLLAPDPREAVKDAGQVRAMAAALSALAPELLGALLDAPAAAGAAVRAAALAEEAWILGLLPDGARLGAEIAPS